MSVGLKEIGTVTVTILIVIFIIYLSYLFSKYMAAGAVKMSRSKHMQIIDKIIMGQDRFIVIVQVGSRFFLIGIAGTNIQNITELEENDLTLTNNNIEGQFQNTAMNFKDILSKLKSNKKN